MTENKKDPWWNEPSAKKPLLESNKAHMGYAHVRDAAGIVSAITFACAACGRRLIWSFTGDWKCPCGNGTFRIDNAVELDATA